MVHVLLHHNRNGKRLSHCTQKSHSEDVIRSLSLLVSLDQWYLSGFPPSGRWAHLRPWELQNWRSHFARGTKFPLTAQGRGEVVKFSKRPIPREVWFWRVVFFFEFEKWEADLFQSKVENGKLGVGQGVPATWSPFTPEAVWSQEGNESFLRDATHWPFCFWVWDSHLVFVDSFLLQKTIQFNLGA